MSLASSLSGAGLGGSSHGPRECTDNRIGFRFPEQQWAFSMTPSESILS
jgi:hypothetical protein